MTDAKPKVLVVDDEALIRMSLSDMLAELGFAALEAGTADDALSHLGSHPDIGLMIADLQLPGMSGAELVQRARELHPGLRIIVATGHAPAVFAAKTEFAGVAFLGKPFELDALQRAVAAV